MGLAWEFLALGVSLEDLGQKISSSKVLVLAAALDEAIGTILNEDKSPSRRVNELDNRGSHFYLSLYWAPALAVQDKDSELERFQGIAEQLGEKEEVIVDELNAARVLPSISVVITIPTSTRLAKLCVRVRPSTKSSNLWHKNQESDDLPRVQERIMISLSSGGWLAG